MRFGLPSGGWYNYWTDIFHTLLNVRAELRLAGERRDCGTGQGPFEAGCGSYSEGWAEGWAEATTSGRCEPSPGAVEDAGGLPGLQVRCSTARHLGIVARKVVLVPGVSVAV